MNVSACLTSADGQGVLSIDSAHYFGPIPPIDVGLRAIYDAWVSEGNIPEPYISPPPPQVRTVAMWRARTIMKVTQWEEGTLFQAVQAAIASLSDPLKRASAEEALERGTDFDRDDFDRDGVFVPMLAAIVGISDEQLTDLMEHAATLPA